MSASDDSRAPEPREEPEKTGLAAIYDFVMQSYCWFAIFFILYVLSAGPLFSAWQAAVATGTNPLLQIFYMPLTALCEQSDMLKAALDWYVSLWS